MKKVNYCSVYVNLKILALCPDLFPRSGGDWIREWNKGPVKL